MLHPEELREMVGAMLEATHEEMGSLTVHTGTHPLMGEITIVVSREQVGVRGD